MTITATQFKEVWERLGSPTLVAKELGLGYSTVRERARMFGLKAWNNLNPNRRVVVQHDEGRIDLSIENGVVLVFSDAHYWPGIRTTAHRAAIMMTKMLQPTAIICNGDAFDGGTISRYPRIGWDKKPSVVEELRAVEASLKEIEDVAQGAETIWCLGNHDARYETKLAAHAPEFEGVRGFTLKDHFPKWRPCWTTWINGDTVITHFYHTGIHATHNNIMKGQCNYVTGHTHSLQLRPWTNAKGETLYGVDTGTIADALGPHNLDYQQGRHGNHRSGFAVLTFREGKLLMPELVQVWDENTINFRGHLLDADTGDVI